MTTTPTNAVNKHQTAMWEPWESKAREVLVSQMWHRRITYKDLSRRLEALGIDELPDQINRKVNRKRFSAAFFLACLSAMDVESLPID